MKKIIICIYILLLTVFLSCSDKDVKFYYGFINEEGKEIISLQYENAFPFLEDLASVKKNGKYGFIDKADNVVIDFKYDYTIGFKEGLAAVEIGNKVGYINKKGDIVIPLEYESASVFINGLACVKKNGKCGYIDKNGKVIIDFKYDNFSYISEGLINVELSKNKNDWDSKWGYINDKGEVVIDFIFDRAEPFNDGIAYIGVFYNKHGRIYDKCGYINKKGKIIVEPIYDYQPETNFRLTKGIGFVYEYHIIGDDDLLIPFPSFINSINVNWFNEDLGLVKKDNKYGYINKKGEVVIPIEYDYATMFNEGLALVEKKISKDKSEYYFIDKNNNKILSYKTPLRFNSFFRNGFTIFKNLDTKDFGLINIKGEIIKLFKYDKITKFEDNFSGVIVNNKWGIIDESGNEIVKPKYDKILPFSEGLAAVCIKK